MRKIWHKGEFWMVNEKIVLDYYLKQIEEDKIEFLVNRETLKQAVIENVKKLRETETIHTKIEIAKRLWKFLFEAAMSHIDHDKGGYDDLFKYFDEYVNFEELIFASDSFYRDHTVHCLWVYFLGEYLYTKDEFGFIVKDMFENQKILIEIFKHLKANNIIGESGTGISILRGFEKLIDCQGAIRCLTALTHDLGYPLKKIQKINKCITNILPHFTISDYQEFDFSFNATQTPFISKFLEYLSMEFILIIGNKEQNNILGKIYKVEEKNLISINKDETQKLSEDEINLLKEIDIVLNTYKNVTEFFRYSQDFEQHQHGILSAFLLIKTMKFFRVNRFAYNEGQEIDPNYLDIFKVISCVLILKAVTNHTSEGFQITKINNSSALLTLMDELEEFSRISRANQNRQFINEFCKTDLYAENGYLFIDFTFDNEEIENLDPELAFKGRCKRFLTLFNISELDEEVKIILRCIGKLSTDNNEYKLEIRRKYANITVNGVEMEIPKYLKSRQFYTKEEYMTL